MIKTFEIQNVKCEGCANTLRKRLHDFKNVSVDFSVVPRKLNIEIEENQITELKNRLLSMGYPTVDDELSRTQELKTIINSYMSCMIGKIN
jgi:copper chaperone